MILGQRADQDIGIRNHFHRLPAQPRAMILFMSSIERTRPFRFAFSRPKTSDIFPAGLAAFTSTRPSGSLSTMIFSPGWTPRWSSRSLRSVTWPLAVTVSVVMAASVCSTQCKAKEPYHQAGADHDGEEFQTIALTSWG